MQGQAIGTLHVGHQRTASMTFQRMRDAPLSVDLRSALVEFFPPLATYLACRVVRIKQGSDVGLAFLFP